MTKNPPTPLRYLAAAAAGVALVAGAITVGGVALAAEAVPPPSAAPTSVVVPTIDEPVEPTFDCAVIFDDLGGDFEDFLDDDFLNDEFLDDNFEQIPQELIDEMNAEADALAAHLDAAGIAFTIVDEGGFRFLDWDFEDDAANEAVDAFYTELLGDLDGAVFEDLPQELIDEMNAEDDLALLHG